MLTQKIPVRLLTLGKTVEVAREPGMTAGKLLEQIGEDARGLTVYDGCKPLAPDARIDPLQDHDLAAMHVFVGG